MNSTRVKALGNVKKSLKGDDELNHNTPLSGENLIIITHNLLLTVLTDIFHKNRSRDQKELTIYTRDVKFKILKYITFETFFKGKMVKYYPIPPKKECETFETKKKESRTDKEIITKNLRVMSTQVILWG